MTGTTRKPPSPGKPGDGVQQQPQQQQAVAVADGPKPPEPKPSISVPIAQQLGLTVDDNGMLDIPSLSYCIVQSGFFPTIHKASQAIMKIMLGKELGIGPMQATMNLHVITEGDRTTIMVGAHTLAGKIKGSGRYNYDVVQYDALGCELQPKELIENKWVKMQGTVKYTVEDAKKAKLGGFGKEGQHFKSNSNWAKDPTSMCFARCVSRLEKVYFPDLSALPMYTPDELGFSVNERGEAMVVNGHPVKEDTATNAQPSQTQEQEAEKPKFNGVVISKLVAVADDNDWADAQALQMLIWEGAVTNVAEAQAHLDAGRHKDVQDMLAGDEKIVDELVEKFKSGPEAYMKARSPEPEAPTAPEQKAATPKAEKKKPKTPQPDQDGEKLITKDAADDLWTMCFDSDALRNAAKKFIADLGYTTFKSIKCKDVAAVTKFIQEFDEKRED